MLRFLNSRCFRRKVVGAGECGRHMPDPFPMMTYLHVCPAKTDSRAEANEVVMSRRELLIRSPRKRDIGDIAAGRARLPLHLELKPLSVQGSA